MAPQPNPYPRECTFSKMDIASIAMHATISTDMLKQEKEFK